MGRLPFGAGIYSLLKKKPTPVFEHLKKSVKAGKLIVKVDKSLEPGSRTVMVSERVYKELKEAEKFEAARMMEQPSLMDRPRKYLSVWFLGESAGAFAGAAYGGWKETGKRLWEKFTGAFEVKAASTGSDLSKKVDAVVDEVAVLKKMVMKDPRYRKEGSSKVLGVDEKAKETADSADADDQ